MRQHLWVNLFIVASIATGCQSGPKSEAPSPQPATQGSDAVNGPPAAYIDGRPVTRSALYQLMVEAQGAQALSDILLDRAIAKRLSNQGITLTEADFAAERDLLLNSLSVDSDEAARLLAMMRQTRGLGDRRFASLIRRNAGLRRLVRDGVTVGEAAIAQAFTLRYGPRYRVRLITSDSVDKLADLQRRVRVGASFSDLATEQSTDQSAAQGGLLSPISPADPTYPKAVRDVLPRLSLKNRDSRISSVIALPDGYALLWLEEKIAASPTPIDTVRNELELAIRLELERVRMQQLARSLVGQANVVVLDPALGQAWQQQRETILDR